MCVATALLHSGMVPMPDGWRNHACLLTEHNAHMSLRVLGGEGDVSFQLEAPGGIVPILASCRGGKVKSVTLTNVPSFVALSGVMVDVPELGLVEVDVVYSGMWYCVVDTKSLLRHSLPSFPLRPECGKSICKYGEMIKTACREQFPVQHPILDYSGCDILIFSSIGCAETVTLGKWGVISSKYCACENDSCTGSTGKNTVVMSNGVLNWNEPSTFTGMLDRSPCGTGTCAVMAKRFAAQQLALGESFVHESIIGSQFTGRIVAETTVNCDLHHAIVLVNFLR